MAKGGKTVLVLSHTHWDREWYEPFESFRFRLVKAMDRLIEILQKDSGYECFNLDGQLVVLEDYLEIRPEMRETLQKLVKSGRIGIGPWYVQADEFLSDGESLIRNLLLGMQLAREFGEVQKLAYLPDTFGHNSQIPQIARQFGISSSLIWRGVSGDEMPWEFIWEGADGSSLYTYRLPERQGYCNMAFTPEGAPVDPAFFVNSADEFIKNSATGIVVLMDGCDHTEPDVKILPLIEYIGSKDSFFSCRQALFNDLSRELERKIPLSQKIPILHGELRRVNTSKRGYFNFILPNVLSSRCDNKRENFEALNLLESYAEPLASFAWLAGRKYPRSFLTKAWKLILQNLAHDSIGGCSVDEVHRDVSHRFSQSKEIAQNVVRDSMASLCSVTGDGENSSFVLFNPSPCISNTVELDVDLPANVLEDSSKLPTVKDEDGKEIEFQISSMKRAEKALGFLGRSAPIEKVVSLKGYLDVKIEGLSFKRFYIELSDRPVNYRKCEEETLPQLENRCMSVRVLPDGVIEILNKATGEKVYSNLFEDSGDAGDGYVYSRPAFDSLATSSNSLQEIEVLDNGPLSKSLRLHYSMLIPNGLTEKGLSRSTLKRELPLQCTLKLRKDSGVLEIETVVENYCENHRLQVDFWKEKPGKAIFYKTPFDIVTSAKDRVQQAPNSNWIEDEPVAFPNGGLFGEIKTSDEFDGFAVSTRGINEFESSAKGLKLTLFRAVGHLASPYPLSCMKRAAGPKIETPEAQMKGSLVFSYALFFMKSLEEALEKSSVYLKKPLAMGFTNELPEGPLAVKGSTTDIASIKKAEDRDSLILRLVNLSTQRDNVKIKLKEALFDRVFLCDASEERKEEISIENSEISLVCKPKEIVTVELQPLGRQNSQGAS